MSDLTFEVEVEEARRTGTRPGPGETRVKGVDGLLLST